MSSDYIQVDESTWYREGDAGSRSRLRCYPETPSGGVLQDNPGVRELDELRIRTRHSKIQNGQSSGLYLYSSSTSNPLYHHKENQHLLFETPHAENIWQIGFLKNFAYYNYFRITFSRISLTVRRD